MLRERWSISRGRPVLQKELKDLDKPLANGRHLTLVFQQRGTGRHLEGGPFLPNSFK